MREWEMTVKVGSGEGSDMKEIVLLRGAIVDTASDGSVKIALHAPYNEIHKSDKIWLHAGYEIEVTDDG